MYPNSDDDKEEDADEKKEKKKTRRDIIPDLDLQKAMLRDLTSLEFLRLASN